MPTPEIEKPDSNPTWGDAPPPLNERPRHARRHGGVLLFLEGRELRPPTPATSRRASLTNNRGYIWDPDTCARPELPDGPAPASLSGPAALPQAGHSGGRSPGRANLK